MVLAGDDNATMTDLFNQYNATVSLTAYSMDRPISVPLQRITYHGTPHPRYFPSIRSHFRVQHFLRTQVANLSVKHHQLSSLQSHQGAIQPRQTTLRVLRGPVKLGPTQ